MAAIVQLFNPLINSIVDPVNTIGTCSNKTYYNNIWDSVQRGYLPNFIFIAQQLTEILAKKVKLILFTPGRHVEIKPITAISELVFREPTYQVSMA